MPIYEYECAACGHRLEALQKVSDKPLRKCPECGKPKLHKLMSAPSFRLKGGGWYETDFKSGQKKNLADGGGKDEKPAAAKAESASAKPEPKAADKPKPAEKKTKTEKTKAKDK